MSTQEKGRLRQMIRAGRSSARAITRARILLKTDQGWTASQVAAALDISERTVRAKRRYAEEGLDEVLRHRNQVSRYRKLDDRGEAHLIALACSPAPEGHDHWTLAGESGGAGTGPVPVPRDGAAAAEKNALKPWRKQQWCIPKVSSEFVAAIVSIGILIADDEELVRTGFRMILEAEDDFEVLGEASTGTEAVEMTQSFQPQVILMDIRMPGMDGLEGR